MRVGLQSWGSDGDIRPFLALGAGLVRAGHTVTLALTSVDGKDYAAQAHGAGITLLQGNARVDPALAREFGQALLATNAPAKHLSLVVEHLLAPSDAVVEEQAVGLVKGQDVVVGHSIIHAVAAAAERAGVPYASVQYQPGGLPTRAWPPQGAPDLGAFFNGVFWALAGKVLDGVMLERINAVRARLGVPAVRSFLREASHSHVLNLVAASPQLVPRAPDWAPIHQVCGWFAMPAHHERAPVTPELETFLGAGPAPVLVTMGSMITAERDPVAFTRDLAEAALATGARVVMQSTPEALAALPEHPNLLRAGFVPHAQVLPRCAALVHHGGAGTTHAACQAGVPSVVVPYYLDQGGWAQALQRAGVAPSPVPRRRFSGRRMTAAVARVLQDTAFTQRARQLAQAMKAEDGVQAAVRAVEALARG